jgi:hypothetical protein
MPQPNARLGPGRTATARIAGITVSPAPSPSAVERGSDRTVIPVASNDTVTVPSRSVRYTRAPAAVSLSSVERAGWP